MAWCGVGVALWCLAWWSDRDDLMAYCGVAWRGMALSVVALRGVAWRRVACCGVASEWPSTTFAILLEGVDISLATNMIEFYP